MKLIGLMPCRNEAWVLGLSARVALLWCDELVIGLHACTDQSASIARGIAVDNPHRVQIIFAEDSKWDEMAQRQALLETARHRNPTHIAIVDADEILCGPTVPQIRGLIESSLDGTRAVVPLYNLRNGIQSYHANGLWGNRITTLAFKDGPHLRWSGDNYHHREPRGQELFSNQRIDQGEGGVMHLWGASERRLIAKHALYKVNERLRWPDKDVRQIDFMYSQALIGGLRENPKDWKYAGVPLEWWLPYAQWMHYLDVDAEPWQEAEVRRLVAEHGREMFAGLNLFGIA